MSRPLHSPVIVKTPSGKFQGVIVGRTIEQHARYDIKARSRVFMNVPESQVSDIPEPEKGGAQ